MTEWRSTETTIPLREICATIALYAMLVSPRLGFPASPKKRAELAVEHADALIEALTTEKEEGTK